MAQPTYNYRSATIRVDTKEFEAAIRMLSARTGKSLPDLVAKKLYYTARRAVWYTKIASFFKISQELGQNIETVKSGKRKGSLRMKKFSTFNTARTASAPLAAILVNFYRAKTGRKGVYGKEMKKAVQKFVGARMRSIGFVKAGWIAARDAMKRKAGIKGEPEGTLMGGTKRRGVARLGGAGISGYGGIFKAAIWNQASYGDGINPHTGDKYEHDAALLKYGQPALEKA